MALESLEVISWGTEQKWLWHDAIAARGLPRWIGTRVGCPIVFIMDDLSRLDGQARVGRVAEEQWFLPGAELDN